MKINYYDAFVNSESYHELLAFLNCSSVTFQTFEEHSEAIWWDICQEVHHSVLQEYNYDGESSFEYSEAISMLELFVSGDEWFQCSESWMKMWMHTIAIISYHPLSTITLIMVVLTDSVLCRFISSDSAISSNHSINTHTGSFSICCLSASSLR